MTNDYLSQGIAAVKAGKVEEARKLLDKAIRAAPDDERTWGWFYGVCLNDTERIKCLKQILRINPNLEQAKQRYNELMGMEIKPIAPITPQHERTAKIKKCPYCAEEIQDEAIVCRHCGRDLYPQRQNPPAQTFPTTPSKPEKKNSTFLTFIIILAVVVSLVILCLVLAPLFGGGSNNSKSNLPTAAKLVCQQFVTNRILSPSTAKFPGITEQKIYTIQGKTDAFEVIGYVDAQNGFGAMIRNYYTCDVQYTGTSNGDDNFNLLNLDIHP